MGALGADATYRLIVRNIGTETLINAVINDATLGLVNVPVPGGPLLPGDVRVIDAGDIGFASLFFPDRCDSVGNKMNIAMVDAVSEPTGERVEDEDPANVNCVRPPECQIDVLKTCLVEPPPPGDGAEGCTPGYWKQSQHFGSWVGFTQTDDFETVFGVDASFSATLLQALQQGGGGELALGRHAVAALLNASNSTVDYFTDVAGVIAFVQQAFASGNFEQIKDLLDLENNRGCPLGNGPGNTQATASQAGTKTCEVPSQGADVRYDYLITNIGDTTVIDVVASDDVLGLLTDPNNPILLAQNESVMLSVTTFVDQDVTNKVTVTAETGAGAECMAMDTVTVTVEPPPPGGGTQGCTPGYWKQSQHFDSWVGFDQSDDFEQVFGVDASFNKTLLGALQQGGGGEKALGRHAVAALLNAANSDVDYFASVAEVIALVQDAYATGAFKSTKDLLDFENNRGCPLN